ncbi:hypothetical protein ADL29_23980 [Streptomyces chattanoogensis]|uniref:Uncharacterized protein n=1 Tax=Streptomyces chattanoogensis TaxID=66876 RepID=A0A0N0GY26_9ACTN|nr:hypothetical protein ADL29_23980 [Streptomyces chattanoogensis]
MRQVFRVDLPSLFQQLADDLRDVQDIAEDHRVGEQGVEPHRLFLLDGVVVGDDAAVAEADPLGVPSAATAVPSPHACERSRRACAFTRSATASFSRTIEKCLLATYDSSCPLTPGMCRAASYGPMSVPLTNVTIT